MAKGTGRDGTNQIPQSGVEPNRRTNEGSSIFIGLLLLPTDLRHFSGPVFDAALGVGGGVQHRSKLFVVDHLASVRVDGVEHSLHFLFGQSDPQRLQGVLEASVVDGFLGYVRRTAAPEFPECCAKTLSPVSGQQLGLQKLEWVADFVRSSLLQVGAKTIDTGQTRVGEVVRWWPLPRMDSPALKLLACGIVTGNQAIEIRAKPEFACGGSRVAFWSHGSYRW